MHIHCNPSACCIMVLIILKHVNCQEEKAAEKPPSGFWWCGRFGARGVTNLPREWHVVTVSCEAQNIPVTLSSSPSTLHSSSFHFYFSSAWYFGRLVQATFILKMHINQFIKLGKVARFLFTEIKICLETMAESVIMIHLHRGGHVSPSMTDSTLEPASVRMC